MSTLNVKVVRPETYQLIDEFQCEKINKDAVNGVWEFTSQGAIVSLPIKTLGFIITDVSAPIVDENEKEEEVV